MSEMSFGAKMKSRLFYADPFHLAEFSDVKLVSNSGECFYSNRLLLSCCSQMFCNMFVDSGGQDEDMTCIFAEHSSETLKIILGFVSRGILVSNDGQVCKSGVVTDEKILNDFRSFGIDLSSLQLTPDVLPQNEKPVQIAYQGFDLTSQIEIKEELELESLVANCEFDENFFEDPENEPLKRKKAVRTKTKTESKNKTSLHNKVSRKRKRVTVSEASGDDEECDGDFVDDCDVSSDASDITLTKKKRKTKDPDFEVSKKKFKSGKFGKRNKYHRREYCDKIDGERNPRKKFQCPYCVQGYNSIKMFKLHVLRHEAADGRTVFFCLQCGSNQRFESPEELKKHKMEFHIDKTYTCDRCGKVYNGNYYYRYKEHVENHDMPKKKYSCVECGYDFKKSLYTHKSACGPFHDGKCAHCGQKFETWREHERHINSSHDGVRLYKCGICPETFDKIYRQRVHRRDAHHKLDKKAKSEPAKTVVCQSCGKLVRECYYETHLANHHGTGEHPCPQCGRIYNHPSVLERHISNYHNPFPCEKCGKTIRSRVKLRLHNLSAHTPEHMKPHQCTVCDPPRGFHTLKTFRDHMNIHTNERPYKCHVCNAGFNNEANMFAHVRSTHKGIKRKK